MTNRSIRYLVLLAFVFLSWYGHLRGSDAFVLPRVQKGQQSTTDLGLPALHSTFAGVNTVSFEEVLVNHLTEKDDSLITVEGYVLSKRSLGKRLVFADFHIIGYSDACQTMLRVEYYKHDFQAACKLLLKGTKVRVTGRASPTRNPGNAVLLVDSIEFIGFPRQLQYIQILIQQYQQGLVPASNFQRALPSDDVLEGLIESLPSAEASALPENKRLVKQLARTIFDSLPDDPDYPQEVDQVQTSKRGNFVVPIAPLEWRSVPDSILRHNNRSKNAESIAESLATSRDESSDTCHKMISLSGWVQNRRRFDENITMIALVEDYSMLLTPDSRSVEDSTVAHQTRRQLAILHPDLLSSKTAGMYRNLVSVGSKVQVSGTSFVMAPSGSSTKENADKFGRDVLWITSIHLEQCSSRPLTIRYLLDLLHEGSVSLDEAQRSLLMSNSDEAHRLLIMNPTQRQWKANELSVMLQDAALSSCKVNVTIPTRYLQILEKYRTLLVAHPIEETKLEDMEELLVSSTLTAPQIMKDSDRPPLAMLPMGTSGTKWQQKKRPQLAWMGEQIKHVLESHSEYGKRRLQILDIGGGKGLLANYLGRVLSDKVQIRVVDICAGAVANGAKKAMRLNLPVDFSLADASETLNLTTVDVVVALHACGHLSDIALAHAVQRRAGFVIVPCCFMSNPDLTIPTDKGNKISVPEWLGVPEDDWTSLKLLAEVQGDANLASQAIAALCAIRAKAANNHLLSNDSSENSEIKRHVSIKRFPIEFSTRNTVLVGLCQ